MKAYVDTISIMGCDIPCPFQIDLDTEELYIECVNPLTKEKGQRIKIDLKSAIEKT